MKCELCGKAAPNLGRFRTDDGRTFEKLQAEIALACAPLFKEPQS